MALGQKQQLLPKLILECSGQVLVTDGRRRRAGDRKTPLEKPAGALGEGLLQNQGLCFRDCITGDKFTAKLLSYEGYHRYIRVTGGAWGRRFGGFELKLNIRF